MKNKKITMEAKKVDTTEVILNFKAGPQTIIYKTKKDYSKLVPIILSEDKSKIISYPHLKDVFYKDNLAYPYNLKDGYLLDNRGINSNVAFLKMTYQEYSQLEAIPTLEKLYTLILDKNPLIEIYNCGNRYTFKNETQNLNTLIENNGLERCKCLMKK